jgi:3-phenylpropionate/cinnamic acid dioxygenase small subunit
MSMIDHAGMTTELRLDVQEFYFRYAECLDGGRLQQWPEFFLDACVYRITTRHSLHLGPGEDFMSIKSKTSMRDRIVAIGQSEDYEPHVQRHIISNFRIQAAAEDDLRVQANFQVLRTFHERPTELFVSGSYQDHIAVSEGRMNFREKICVFDSEVLPESLIYPI